MIFTFSFVGKLIPTILLSKVLFKAILYENVAVWPASSLEIFQVIELSFLSTSAVISPMLGLVSCAYLKLSIIFCGK